MQNNLRNRNVNTAFNVFALSYGGSNENLKNVNKDNHIRRFGMYENFNENFNVQMKTEGDKTVDSDIESIILDLNKLGGLSSSSSLSWSDGYETETTKKVFDELKKLDGVLRGEDPIPENYDMEECQEWMKHFPNLSIFDDNDTTPTNSVENLDWHRNHIQTRDPSCNYDHETIHKKSNYRMNVSSPKRINSNGSIPIVNKKRLFKGQNGVKNNNLFFISKPRSLDVDKYLKVSPVLHSRRKQSSKSLLSTQISTESPDNPHEYSSLPHIIESLPSLKLQKCSQQIRKKSIYAKTGRNDNQLILPTIDIEHFRSVSAMPGENFKTLSALSVNLNNKQKFKNNKHSTEPVKFLLNCKRPRNILL